MSSRKEYQISDVSYWVKARLAVFCFIPDLKIGAIHDLLLALASG